MKLILRVDDCGWRPEDKSPDRKLEYFRKWRHALKAVSPRYDGWIPSTVTDDDIKDLGDLLTSQEEISVHGHTHKRGEVVGRELMDRNRDRFQDITGRTVRTYIPPFNDYKTETVENWGHECPGGVFFGGFNGEHHNFGDLPVKVGKAVHLPAIRELYDRAGPILKNLGKWSHVQAPLVVTLHATWDAQNIEALGPLADEIGPHLTSVDYVSRWLEYTALDVNKLTAPHFMAYSWILGNVRPFSKVLDFGSRYSVLPSQMALRGCDVTAFDRDKGIHDWQMDKCVEYDISFGSVSCDLEDFLATKRYAGFEDLDFVTACWSIQHNLKSEERSAIAKRLAASLKPDGELLVVSSFTGGDSFYQTERKDPQRVSNWNEHMSDVIVPSGLDLAEAKFFRYEHGSVKGDWNPSEPNAVCYKLRKKVSTYEARLYLS